jgi:hypothetical protein
MSNRFNKDTSFVLALDALLKIKDRKELRTKAKKLEQYVLANCNPFLAFRLAMEFEDLDISTTKLQNLIISSKDARYIYRYAYTIKKADIKNLQDAIIKCGNILQITKFGCFIRGANRSEIEKLIIKSDNAKAAYFYLRFVKHCNINKLKPIILKSRRPRYLFALARKLKNKKEIDYIQNLIINGTSYMYMRLFAVHIKNADIKRLEEKIIASKNIDEMKKFAKAVKSERLLKLSLLF